MTTTRRIQATGALLSLLLVSALVYRTSDAAFSDTTDNVANNWASGTVVLVDDDLGAVMFNTTNMVPGDSISNCIEVDYTGSSFDLDPVTLYGSVTDNGLGDHLDIVISEGTGGGFGTCTGFSGSTTFTGTLNAFETAHPNYAGGDAGYTPVSGSTARVYKVDVTLGNDTPNSAQAKNAQATFTWEVRSA